MEIDRWIKQYFEYSDRPVMLCTDRLKESVDGEAERIMIVSEQWPSYSKKWPPVSVVINTVIHTAPSDFHGTKRGQIMKLSQK